VTAAIELTGITKRFPGVIANDNINFTVEQGEIHAICGENGAGKSTLMKILYGMQGADEGVMKVSGEVVTFNSPTDAIERGIGMVHQHFMLADQLTVLENVILGSEPTLSGGRIDFDGAEKHLREVGAAYGLDIDPHDLGPAGRPVVDDLTLTVHKGEIVGIAGIEGNGQTELVDAIIGTAEATSGTIALLGTDITTTSVRDRREGGLGYVPQDRHREGLLLDAPLWENAALGHQTSAPYASGFWIDRAGARKQTEAIREEFDVRSPNVEVSARALSGGNQQKLIIGREMSADPSVLIAAHPTRGIDVGAQADVWNQIREARANGLATLLISADLDELIGLSDTIVVMFHGELVATLDPAEITPRLLGSYMTGAALDDKARHSTQEQA